MSEISCMSELWICPGRLFDGQEILTHSALRIVDGCVADIINASELPPSATCMDVPGLVTPGFVDLQVNGGGGVLLNTSRTKTGMLEIANAHRRFGTVAVLPTLISDSQAALSDIVQAAVDAKGQPGIAGVHLEGPHIALEKRGTHASEFIRPMDKFTLDAVKILVRNDIKTLITVAPEALTIRQIEQLVDSGVIVSLGHTNATAAMMQSAIEAGASCVTHLFNAMSAMTGREQGAVGAAINSDCYVGIICDGHHVSDEMVGLAIRARPTADRMVLVSDAMPTVGGPDQFELYNQVIRLEDGRLINREGSLAGAHVTQLDGVRRLVEKTGTSLTHALRMAITNPAVCMGLESLGRLMGRHCSDLIVLSDGLQLDACLADYCSESTRQVD